VATIRSGLPVQSMSMAIAPRGSRPRHGNVGDAPRLHRTAREHAVAEVAVVPLERGSRHRLVAHLLAEPREHVGAVVVGLDFLQRIDVGVDLAQHAQDAIRIGAPVASDGAMDVIGRDPQVAHRLLRQTSPATPCGAARRWPKYANPRRPVTAAAMSQPFTRPGSCSAAANWSESTVAASAPGSIPRNVPITKVEELDAHGAHDHVYHEVRRDGYESHQCHGEDAALLDEVRHAR
jgi:hypothetical protein